MAMDSDLLPPPDVLPPLGHWRRVVAPKGGAWYSSGRLPHGGYYEILVAHRPSAGTGPPLSCRVIARSVGAPARTVGPPWGHDLPEEAWASAACDYELAQREDHEVVLDVRGDEFLVVPCAEALRIKAAREAFGAVTVRPRRGPAWPARPRHATRPGRPQPPAPVQSCAVVRAGRAAGPKHPPPRPPPGNRAGRPQPAPQQASPPVPRGTGRPRHPGRRPAAAPLPSGRSGRRP